MAPGFGFAVSTVGSTRELSASDGRSLSTQGHPYQLGHEPEKFVPGERKRVSTAGKYPETKLLKCRAVVFNRITIKGLAGTARLRRTVPGFRN
jgi:hypothetical protein